MDFLIRNMLLRMRQEARRCYRKKCPCRKFLPSSTIHVFRFLATSKLPNLIVPGVPMKAGGGAITPSVYLRHLYAHLVL